MARVRNIPSSELPPATRDVYERYASAYGPFANQVAVFAHVPPAVDHREFHLALLSNCGSRWLLGFCEQLYDQAYRYRQLAMKSAYKRRDESDEHKQVVDAVVAGNVAAACAALTHHYEKTAQIILSIE